MIWNKILEWLELDQKIIFLHVINSEGSSPGRAGFTMIINERHEMFGSIGGGFMEHKLIELCKNDLLNRNFKPFIKRQIHKDDVEKEKSGMICSGEQTISFYQIDKKDILVVSEIVQSLSDKSFGVLTSTEMGLHFDVGKSLSDKYNLEILSAEKWIMKEDLGILPELHIVGGGHVGLALSKLAKDLGFSVYMYDNREGLNTINANKYATYILVSDYAKMGDQLANGVNKYVVLMSFGYKTDKIILAQLLNKEFKYLGMMGSQAKVDRLFNELASEGFDKTQIEKVHAPIGIPIDSKTPKEIAISILAELIQVKNS